MFRSMVAIECTCSSEKRYDPELNITENKLPPVLEQINAALPCAWYDVLSTRLLDL